MNSILNESFRRAPVCECIGAIDEQFQPWYKYFDIYYSLSVCAFCVAIACGTRKFIRNFSKTMPLVFHEKSLNNGKEIGASIQSSNKIDVIILHRKRLLFNFLCCFFCHHSSPYCTLYTLIDDQLLSK